MIRIVSNTPIVQRAAEVLFGGVVVEGIVDLLLDTPPGFALVRLPRTTSPVLVITTNTNTLYLHDLLDLNPTGVIAEPVSPSEVCAALAKVVVGERLYYGPPLGNNPLTHCERLVLRLLAFGSDQNMIAEQLGVTRKSVANRLAEIKEKLGFRNTLELTLWYRGVHVSNRPSEPAAFSGR